MNKINIEKHIAGIKVSEDELYIIGNKYYNGDLGFKTDIEWGMRFFFKIGNQIIIQKKSTFEALDIYTLDGEFIGEKLEGYNLTNCFKYGEEILAYGKKEKAYCIIDKALSVKDTEFYMHYHVKIGNYFYQYKKDLIQFDFEKEKTNWVATLPSPIFLSSGTQLLGDNNNVYIPLKDYSLNAFDTLTGISSWTLAFDAWSGFDLNKSSLFLHNGRSIIEIDGNSGEIIRAKVFSEYSLLKNHKTSGPIWAYDEVVILIGLRPSRVFIFDRVSLELMHLLEINERIPNDRSAIHWHNNKLYLLDIEHNLHIYEAN